MQLFCDYANSIAWSCCQEKWNFDLIVKNVSKTSEMNVNPKHLHKAKKNVAFVSERTNQWYWVAVALNYIVV